MKYSDYGFTLIKLAMVLFILSLLLGTLLTPLATSIEQRDRDTTTKLLEEIRESLLGYALVNGHFPCPDCPDDVSGNCDSVEGVNSNWDNDGIEDGYESSGPTASNVRGVPAFDTCATEVGNLPWVTLGVAENDAWGNRFIYRVAAEFADETAGTSSCTNPASGVSFCLDSFSNTGSDADIDINDENGSSVAENVPVAVVSVGNNSSDVFASLSALEQENQDGDEFFISADYREQSGSEFDDLLVWVTPASLIYQMVKAEKLP